MSDSPTPPEHDQRNAGRYVVIARRYRPQSFEDLVGQEHIARSLRQAIASDRVGHAYLFTGARGVGKTSAARILAKALNCERGPTPTPCNECDVCRSVSTGDDVDVLEIDGASNRGIDEIRQLRQNVAVRPSRVRYKIYIIDEVHMLTKEAFNALLKTLEEPPAHVKFIFATTEPQKIPITILSRCQRFDFAGIDASAIQNRLAQIAAAEGVDVEPAALQILAGRAAGSMRDSQSLLEQLLAAGRKRVTADEVNQLLGIATAERLSGLVRHLVDRNTAGALAELDAAVRDGAEIGLLLDQLVGYFRDVMIAAAGCPAERLLYATPGQADEIFAIGRQLGLSTILAIGQVLDQAASRMRISVHGRTLVEMALVRICQLGELDELADLVAELRGSGGSGTHPTSPQSAAAKKNVEASRNAPVAMPPRAVPTVAAEAEVGGQGQRVDRVDLPHKVPQAVPELEAAPKPESVAASAVAAESVLAQWQRAVAGGQAGAAAPPPRATRREQIAAVAERPFVRRAVELFDVPPGQLRYTPPESEVS